MSVWRRQIILVKIPPKRAILKIGKERDLMRGYMKLETRRIPNPPNFKRIAARIIEPATGAST